jgi:hypothetical protein
MNLYWVSLLYPWFCLWWEQCLQRWWTKKSEIETSLSQKKSLSLIKRNDRTAWGLSRWFWLHCHLFSRCGQLCWFWTYKQWPFLIEMKVSKMFLSPCSKTDQLGPTVGIVVKRRLIVTSVAAWTIHHWDMWHIMCQHFKWIESLSRRLDVWVRILEACPTMF